MTVAVDQSDISGQDLTSPDDLIDSTGSIQYIIGLIRTEYCGRITFRITGGTFVIEQGAELRNGNGKVAAESVKCEFLREKRLLQMPIRQYFQKKN